jgi:hypothetical protein
MSRHIAATAGVHVDVDAVLDRLLFGDDREPDARTLTIRILDPVGARAKLVLGYTDRPVEVVHESKPDGGGAMTWCNASAQKCASSSGDVQSITSWFDTAV